jgi:hypothetical protein
VIAAVTGLTALLLALAVGRLGFPSGNFASPGGVSQDMGARFVCAGALVLCGWPGQAHASTIDEALQAARALLQRQGADASLDEDRAVGLALHLAGGCPATLDGDPDTKARQKRRQAIDALIAAVAESGTQRGLTKLLQLASCGVESKSWGREQILERTMARTIAVVPCTGPLPGEVASQREKLADFPLLRLRKGVLRAESPTGQELDDLAYFMTAVADAGEEVGARDEGADWSKQAPANAARQELFEQLAAAKSAGNVVQVERLARGYLETLNFPDTLHGAAEDAFFWHAPRYYHVMRDLAQSWEALGRYHEAAGIWRRMSQAGAACGTGADYVWQQQVKAVIRDEEIAGRCEVAVPERLLAVESSRWNDKDVYGTARLASAGFDVARLLRGALLTINRDAGEAAVEKAIDGLPATPRLFAQMRLREKGLEDWERRVHAARGVADTMREAAIPLLLRAAEQSLPAGRPRAIAALGDLAERPFSDPCRGLGSGRFSISTDWVRPVTPVGQDCGTGFDGAARKRLAQKLAVYAKDRDVDTREAVAAALGKIAEPVARPVLRRLLDDGERRGESCQGRTDGSPEKCRPYYPVREAARAALGNILEIERNWREQRAQPSHPQSAAPNLL